MTRVVITDCDHPSIDIERSVFEAAGFEVTLAHCRTEDEVSEAGQGAQALLVQYAPVTRRVLEALPDCRAVARYGAGLDTIDVPAARERGVAVISVPDYSVDEVSDHALALILALTRGIVRLDRDVHRGRWDFMAAGELRRSGAMQVGVVGIGRIGRALADKARGVGFQVVAYDPYMHEADGYPLISFDELLASSHVVCLHAPLSDETRHLLDARAIAKMRAGAYVVNTSRGGLIDQAALVTALRDGRLAGAALDVLEREPVGPDDPLLSLPNVILTPHTAFYSRESIAELKRRAAEGIVQALAGGPTVRSASGAQGPS